MGYLLTTLVAAFGLAVATLATETSSKYFARYVVENESADLGASIAGAGAAAALPPAAGATGSATTGGATTDASGPPAQRVGAMTPILAETLTGSAAPTPAVPTPAVSSPPEPAAGTDMAALVPADLAREEPAGVSAAADPSADPPAPLDGGPAQAILSLVRDTPHRRPDGAIFLPITTQRLFSMRWQVVRRQSLPATYEVPGRVVTDPGTETRIYASRPGVLESVNGRFPYLGMAVRKGDLLADLRPTFDVGARAQIAAQMENLTNQISLTEKQIVRLKEVLFVRYRENKIAALKVEAQGYRRQLAALDTALHGREGLRAATDGVISGVHATVGATVDANTEIFQIVDPDALWVQAAAYDPDAARNVVGGAALTADGRSLELEFVGGGLTLTNQAIPLRFRVLGSAAGLSVGTPVTVIVRSTELIDGIPVPASSVVLDADGRNLVWKRVSAEIFRPHYVETVKLAGDRVALRSDIPSGVRIVTAGASILSQVR